MRRTPDFRPTTGTAAADDRASVHHFIRVHGRRPTTQALPGARARPAIGWAAPIRLRRELARFITRL
ncbi:hypothetical protein [Nocardioides sp. SYSU DS0663]|uniref:hypothetical protein n=1 Tax=Nocardioides sp. SYSU DS0663 TaxID=3416445 RepID=UPI003F4C3D20